MNNIITLRPDTPNHCSTPLQQHHTGLPPLGPLPPPPLYDDLDALQRDYEDEVKEMMCNRWLDDHNNGIHYDPPWIKREPRSYALCNKNKVPLFDAEQLQWLNASQKTKEAAAIAANENDYYDEEEDIIISVSAVPVFHKSSQKKKQKHHLNEDQVDDYNYVFEYNNNDDEQ